MKESQEVRDAVQSTIKALTVPAAILRNELNMCATNTEAPDNSDRKTSKRAKTFVTSFTPFGISFVDQPFVCFFFVVRNLWLSLLRVVHGLEG